MEYTVIDLAEWPRREYYEHYMSDVPCTYSLTASLDITALRRRGHRLYPAMLYLLTRTVNRHEQFRMALRPGGELVLYSSMTPCYTVFHASTGTFSNIWTEYSEDYRAFLRSYACDMEKYGNLGGFQPKPGAPENCFTVSMLPWTTFEGFNLNTAGFKYLIPIFTMGKCRESGGRTTMPIAVQVHHAVCDGFHVCRFLDDLQTGIDSLE